MSNRHQIVSLFSGAGGLDLAFEASGYFSTALYVESEPLFAETLRLNQRAGHLRSGAVVQNDITVLDPVTTCRSFVGRHFEPFGLIGGPPCESFSVIGKHRGRHDKRGALVFTFADWARRLPVRFFVMENVPGLLSIENGAVFTDLIRRFEQAGFAVTHAVLRAADYGAATMRQRLFIVGTRRLEPFVFPKRTHGKAPMPGSAVKPWVTSRDALAGLPAPALAPPGVPLGHVLIKHTEVVRRRFAALAQGEVDPVRKRNRLSAELPAPGLYAGNLSGIRFHIHHAEPREITNREAARIQGFPDEYLFNGTRVPVGKQIANAVPIPLGLALASAFGQQCGLMPAEQTMRKVGHKCDRVAK